MFLAVPACPGLATGLLLAPDCLTEALHGFMNEQREKARDDDLSYISDDDELPCGFSVEAIAITFCCSQRGPIGNPRSICSAAASVSVSASNVSPEASAIHCRLPLALWLRSRGLMTRGLSRETSRSELRFPAWVYWNQALAKHELSVCITCFANLHAS
jgi:hypothetical protein